MSMEIATGNKIKPSVDRLRGFPDDILCHILSFLRTKDSVATSALSRRWRFLWLCVPKLDFHSDVCDDRAGFKQIFNRVLFQYSYNAQQSLNTLRLDVHEHEFSDYELNTWLIIAIARNLQTLFLILPWENALPLRIFTCKTLVDLKLYCYIIPEMGSICLPRLKKLHLSGFVCESNESIPHLLSGCPVLEELRLEYTSECENSDCWYISSPTIKTLSLECCYPNNEYDIIRVEINTPALIDLRVTNWPLSYISFGLLTSLIEADIILSLQHSEMEIEDEGLRDLSCRALVETVDSLCQVKSLNLKCRHLKVVDSIAFAPWTIRFNNLTKLQWNADCSLLSKILEAADNLQVLIIEQVPEHLHCWTEPQQVPKCLLSHLTTIEIPHLRCQENELETVRYLLRNARVLKSLQIKSPLHIVLNARSNAFRRISLFQ